MRIATEYQNHTQKGIGDNAMPYHCTTTHVGGLATFTELHECCMYMRKNISGGARQAKQSLDSAV